MTAFSLRRMLGATVLDLPRSLVSLMASDGWIRLRNRGESFSADPMGVGLRCDFRWTSSLNACEVHPWLARIVMARAVAQWRFSLEPSDLSDPPGVPDASFIVPFRGADRLQQLLIVVGSILAQTDVSAECIVVEQAQEPTARDRLPPAVRYVHLPHPTGDDGWHKAWAFNVGAAAARAPVLF